VPLCRFALLFAMLLPWGAAAQTVTQGSASTAPNGISSLSDLDRGAAAWSKIAPGYHASTAAGPVTKVAPLAPGRETRPNAQADTALLAVAPAAPGPRVPVRNGRLWFDDH
jgi:hypothetical protein